MEQQLKTDLSKYSRGDYSSGRNFLINILWYLTSLVIFQSKLFPIYGLKRFVLRIFGAKIGKNVVMKPGVNIKYPWNLSMGDNVWIGEGVWIDNLADISIGNNACISQGALLLTGNHNYKKSTFNLITREIILEDGVWIGAKSVVCPGVKCFSHAVLSVGSVAVKDLEAYHIYQGNPATKVRKRIIEE